MTQQRPAIFNPLDYIEDAPKLVTEEDLASSESGDGSVSVSGALSNTQIGVCPRCSTPMTTAGVTKPIDLVYFCTSCRITQPLTDEDCLKIDAKLRASRGLGT